MPNDVLQFGDHRQQLGEDVLRLGEVRQTGPSITSRTTGNHLVEHDRVVPRVELLDARSDLRPSSAVRCRI